MPHDQALFCDVVEQGGIGLVRLDGVINEDNRLNERLTNVANKKLIINLSRVDRINSCGVRDFVKWIQQLEGRGNTVHFVSCSPAIVAQLNMVRNFAGQSGHVVSIEAPYYCQTCDAEQRETFLSSAVGSGDNAPLALCRTCGEAMEFDDLPQSYFSFAKQHGARPVDAEVSRSMNRFDAVHLATKVVALKELSSGASPGLTAAPTAPRPGSRSGSQSGSTRGAPLVTPAEPVPARPVSDPAPRAAHWDDERSGPGNKKA